MLSSLALGFLAGLLGVIPFASINLAVAFFGRLPAVFSSSVFFAAMAASHAAVELAPAVLLAWPSQSGLLSYPARLLGRGGAAGVFRFIAEHALVGLVAAALVLPVYLFAAPGFEALLSHYSGWLLLAVVAVFLLRERTLAGALVGAFAFAACGLLGALVFISGVREPLFPLLAGLFGVPAVLALSAGEVRPVAGGFRLKLALLGVLLGAVGNLVPAVTPALLACLAFLFLEEKPEEFLALNASIIFSRLLFDLAGSMVLMPPRSVSSVAAASSVVAADFWGALAVGAVVVVSAALALCLSTVLFSRLEALSKLFFKPGLRAVVLAIVACGVLAISGWLGLLVFAVSASFGLCLSIGRARQSYAAGSLVVPSLLHFFGFSFAFFSVLF